MRNLRAILVSGLLVLGLVVGASAAGAEEPSEGSAGTVPAESAEAAPDSPAAELTPDAGCPSGLVCVFTGYNFSGAEGLTPCSQGGIHPLAGDKHSGTNGCESRAVFLRYSGAFTGICLSPFTSDPNILFNEIRIGEVGSHC